MKIVIALLLFMISAPIFAACSPAGSVQYTSGEYQFCDGSAWVSMKGSSIGSCSGTTAGTQRYTAGDMQFCDGTNWYSMKGSLISGCSGTTAGTQRYASSKMQFCDGTNWYALEGVVDSDGDGVPDDTDAFPNDPSETLDSDSDGVGNNADPFDYDADIRGLTGPKTCQYNGSNYAKKFLSGFGFSFDFFIGGALNDLPAYQSHTKISGKVHTVGAFIKSYTEINNMVSQNFEEYEICSQSYY